MFTMIKIEMKRAIKNKLFIIALLFGCFITISHVFQLIIPKIPYLSLHLTKGFFPDSVFNTWIGGEGYTLQNYVFFLILPILASIPYADTFYLDKKSGYIKNVFIRTQKMNYYTAKYIATFLSGGIAVCIPLLINLGLTAVFMPSIIPQAGIGLFFSAKSMWTAIFFTNPYLYVFLYLGIDFLFAGLLATFALTISFYASNRFIVLVTPFIIYFFASTITRLLNLYQFDPIYFISPDQPIQGITFTEILCIMSIAFIVSAGIFFIKGKKDETF